MSFFNINFSFGFPCAFNALSYSAGYMLGNYLFNSLMPKPQIYYPQYNFYNNNSSVFNPQNCCFASFNPNLQLQTDLFQPCNCNSFNYNSLWNSAGWSNNTQISMPTMIGWNGYFSNYSTTKNVPSETSSSSSSSSNANANVNTTTKKSTDKHKHWTEMTDSEMREVYGNYTRSVEKNKTHTAEELNRYLNKLPKDSVLIGKGKAFAEAESNYGIDAVVLIAICMNESAKGTSNLAKNKNNVSSISTGKSGPERWKKFNSVEECIDYTAKLLKNNYVDNAGKGKHLTKLYEVNSKYCPAAETSANSNWAKNVESYVKSVERCIA